MIKHQVTITCDGCDDVADDGQEVIELLRYEDGQMVEQKHYFADHLEGIPFPTPTEGQQIQITRGRVL